MKGNWNRDVRKKVLPGNGNGVKMEMIPLDQEVI